MASIVDKQGNIPYFGHLSWGNFLDWLITVLLAAIFILFTKNLGGVRVDTHVVLFPLFSLLLALHGIWFAVNSWSKRCISQVPLWFVPSLLWILGSVIWISPVPWRGWIELIFALEMFIVLWVLANNVRTRAHLWFLLVACLIPSANAIFIGFFQFFQTPNLLADALTEYPLEMSSEFLGRSTGSFADPNSFAAYLVILMPLLLITAAVKRLPVILRVLALYIGLIMLLAICFTQTYWAMVLVAFVLALVPWFCFRATKQKIIFSIIGLSVAALTFCAMLLLNSSFKNGLADGISPNGEGVRIILWKESIALILENPFFGVGAGAFQHAFEQSSRLSLADSPLTPHNDGLLFLSQFGVLGFILFLCPFLLVVYRAFVSWKKEPFAVKLRESKDTIMPPERFFLSLGLVGIISFVLCMNLTFVWYVPALSLYGVLIFSVLFKSSMKRNLPVPKALWFKLVYGLLAVTVACFLHISITPKLESYALERRGSEQLDRLVALRVHMSDNVELLNEVIRIFDEAISLDSNNADALIGRSASACQLFFRNPFEYAANAEAAVSDAREAVRLCPDYWHSWAQLGIALSFKGEAEEAGNTLAHALQLAPNNSNANYYYASYLSAFSDRRDEALERVVRALEINPQNPAARRLEQKLRIL